MSYPTSENEPSDDLSSPQMPANPELLFEQKFGKVMADNEQLNRERKELQKELRELHDRLARLQENNVGSSCSSPRTRAYVCRLLYKKGLRSPKTWFNIVPSMVAEIPLPRSWKRGCKFT